MRACEARTIKVQLALVEVEADMGPLEVMPRTHLLPEPANGTADGGGVGVMVQDEDRSIFLGSDSDFHGLRLKRGDETQHEINAAKDE